ncbi:MAG: hypothetical protein AAFV93_18715, partial [Chloroflexota bacterium]
YDIFTRLVRKVCVLLGKKSCLMGSFGAIVSELKVSIGFGFVVFGNWFLVLGYWFLVIADTQVVLSRSIFFDAKAQRLKDAKKLVKIRLFYARFSEAYADTPYRQYT